MAKIRVHVLTETYMVSHIELWLENISVEPSTYYLIDIWSPPFRKWLENVNINLGLTMSKYTFDIEGDPETMRIAWEDYYRQNKFFANMLGKNCAVAAQWFLSRFCGIPKPDLSNLSVDLLALGIFWPSFVPCPITLPGRIISNVKFHIEARKHPAIADKYDRTVLYIGMALSTLLIAGSIVGLSAALTILTAGISPIAASCFALTFIGGFSTFFKSYNLLSAKNIAEAQPLSEVEPKLDLTNELEAQAIEDIALTMQVR